MLALVCDYRVMIDGSKRRAWMCMNEVSSPFHFGIIVVIQTNRCILARPGRRPSRLSCALKSATRACIERSRWKVIALLLKRLLKSA